MQVHLDAKAKSVIDEVFARRGIPQKTAISRILHWYAEQDDKLRSAILDKDAGARRDLSLLALAQMAGVDAAAVEVAAAKFDIAGATKSIRALLDRVDAINAMRTGELAQRLAKPKGD